ncbi:CocE/NonD family hydrolase [Paraburkholderia dipogonis]|uniref:CocE/NonD family hydrolase n=1 Tax=Paraburkholderia dipogonis TaxID=1211383 RepID=UPI0035F03F04
MTDAFSRSGALSADSTLNPFGDVMVPMRDGVRLATDVYFPAGYRVGIDAPLPTILERTPYGKSDISRSEIHHGEPPANRADVARYFAARGYAVVLQDCRGGAITPKARSRNTSLKGRTASTRSNGSRNNAGRTAR